MGSNMHPHYNYNKRHSTSGPYPAPMKYQHNMDSVQGSRSRQSHGSFSGSQSGRGAVPSLSREFVVRRISEGESGRVKEELKCEACGKGYKHISSLAKHLWEHTPEWNVTKKLLMSKHQQVQLLEAASILVGMNEDQAQSRRNSLIQEENLNPPDPKFTPTPVSGLSDALESPPEAIDVNTSNLRVPNRESGLLHDHYSGLNKLHNGDHWHNRSRAHSISYLPSQSIHNKSDPALSGKYFETYTETTPNMYLQQTANANSSRSPSSSIAPGSETPYTKNESDNAKSPLLVAQENGIHLKVSGSAVSSSPSSDDDDDDKAPER